ncbi:MAG: hypothetical protein HQK91_06220 [Nitrospirae bacterium]|nr:hypothetical protein [Nitrospirota bacterium]
MKLKGGTKKVLITVKTYPNPSTKYEETVCVAGIDLSTGKWIRLYPITYRDLDDNQKFKKYCIIEVNVKKANNDHRPESYKVDTDSIKIIKCYDTKKGWKDRKQFILPAKSPSFCDILEQSIQHDVSLGMFKPHNINFEYKKAKPKDQIKREAAYAKGRLFNKPKEPIETIPYDFRYDFYCLEKNDCPGHNLMIIDWEIGQAYRKWRSLYPNESILMNKFKEKWINEFCSIDRDTYFIVGNTQRFRHKSFMVLGVFYPPLEKTSKNLRLF